MNHIILNIPIEPIEERYSKQWDNWFGKAFHDSKLPYINVYGQSTSGTITNGAFLDVIETNRYKTEQLQTIMKYLESAATDGTKLTLFFHDLWFPGLSTIAYIRDGLGLQDSVKICGCLHAGTYDKHDFLSRVGMGSWGRYLENAWFRIVDKVFVATKYHRTLLLSERLIQDSKIEVTGFPLLLEPMLDCRPPINSRKIVFPHRLDPEKNPQLFDAFCECLPDYEGVKSKEVCSTKTQYYTLLMQAKYVISFAEQETWGIAMQEGVYAGALPIVPDRLSYSEMYPKECLFDGTVLGAVKTFRRLENLTPERWVALRTEIIGTLVPKNNNAIGNIFQQFKKLWSEEKK